MKIGYLRFNGSTELYLQAASVNMLGTELRVGMFHDWLEAGHKVSIFSFVPEKHARFLEGVDWFCPSDCGWIQNLDYNPRGYPEDCDVLFVECGPTNTRYSYTLDKQSISYIKRSLDVIRHFEGKVVYFQHSAILPFPIKDAYRADKEDLGHLAELNLTRLLQDVSGGVKGLFHNKEWIVLMTCKDVQGVIKINLKGHGYGERTFDEQPIKAKYLPLGYSDIEPWHEVRDKPMWDACWVGGQFESNTKTSGKRFDRLEVVRDFYDSPEYRSIIIGRWQTPNFKYAKYVGQRGYHGDAYSFWNDSYTGIWTSSDLIRKLGQVPSRVTMILRGGAILLADNSINGVQDLVDSPFLIESAEHVAERIAWIKDQSVEDREFLRRKQLEKFTRWKDYDWKDIFEV